MTAGRVCLAISSFRNDESVARLLEVAASPAARARFGKVIVVDSLGTGRIPELVRQAAWEHVVYESATINLGSAGNFARRLELAAELGFDWVFALNHDGRLDLGVVERLVQFATDRPRCGAAYPLRWVTKQQRFRVVGKARVPLPVNATRHAPSAPAVEVTWSSSNASLYALAPVRAGLLPWADLWMGWEDLGYGRALDAAGWEQFVVTDARCDDDYEYATHRLLGRTLYLTDKPSWYAYYQARNLVLVTRRTRRSQAEYLAVGARLAQEVLVTALFRRRKRERFSLLLSGLRDGLLDRSGKGVVP